MPRKSKALSVIDEQLETLVAERDALVGRIATLESVRESVAKTLGGKRKPKEDPRQLKIPGTT